MEQGRDAHDRLVILVDTMMICLRGRQWVILLNYAKICPIATLESGFGLLKQYLQALKGIGMFEFLC